jgi:hypothetical protein
MVVILRSFLFFLNPWHPWRRLSSGDIWFELEKSSKFQCVIYLLWYKVLFNIVKALWLPPCI